MDFITDESGRHLANLQRKMDLPEFVKTARLDHASVEGLPDSAFGRPWIREYPLDTPEHAFLGYAYARLSGDKDTGLTGVLKQACRHHGVSELVGKLDQILDTPSTNGVHSKYALTLDFGSQVKNAAAFPGQAISGPQGFYPLNTEEDIRNSASRLGNAFSEIPRDLFAKAAAEVVKAAQEHKLPQGAIPLLVRRYGELRWPDWDFVKEQATRRKNLTGDELYEELAISAEKDGDEDNLIKYASLWHELDVLALRNGRDLSDALDAFEIFQSGPTKQAVEKALEGMIVVAATGVPRSAVQALPEYKIKKRLLRRSSANAIDAIKKSHTKASSREVSETIAQLPMETQRELLRLLIEN